MRLRSQPDERIDRGHPIKFTYAGKRSTGFAGDTVGSALYAAGRRVFSRSFKYHRPRGLALLLRPLPELHDDRGRRPERARLRRAAPARTSTSATRTSSARLDRDLLGVVDKVGGPFTPVGFYYRTMIRPRRAWPLYEKVLRNLAGLGRVDETTNGARPLRHRAPARRRPRDRRRAGRPSRGPSGRGRGAPRRRPAAATRRSTSVLAPATALAIYEGGLVPVAAGNVLHRIRAGRIVVADRRARAAAAVRGQRPRRGHAPRRRPPDGRRVGAQARRARGSRRRGRGRGEAAARAAGVEIAAVSLRPESLAAHGRRGRLALGRARRRADRLRPARRLGRPAARLLAARAGGRADRVRAAARNLRPHRAARPASRSSAPPPARSSRPRRPRVLDGHGDKCFVCICEDVTTKDVKRALAEGFDSIELAKRYTTVTMGPCQGKLCQLAVDEAARARDRHRRVGDRHDDGPPALETRRARAARRAATTSRRSGRRSTTGTRRWARR